MGQGAAKAKKGAEEEGADKGEKKVVKKAHKSNDIDELIAFMKENYDEKVKKVQTFDEFYHAIYELMEMFCESRGQLQYRIPSKKDLEEEYKKVGKTEGGENLKADEFEKIARGVLKVNSFAFGQAAMDILVVLFGAPVCALVTKRFVPGLKSISDDIVIPAATSAAVIYLAKTNKL